jgi:hypothetical protein
MLPDRKFFGSALTIAIGSQPGRAAQTPTSLLTADWGDLDCLYDGRSSLPNIYLSHRI